jgi:hypothetical protein
MFKLPFSYLPGSWGLKGKTREIAQAEYELTGYDLDRRLIEINAGLLDEDGIKKKLLELDRSYNKISDQEYKRNLLSFIKDEKQSALASLELDLKDGKINETEYNKQSATIRGEPWVTVIGMDFKSKNSLEGSFELDWNEYFVENLIKEGYTGPTPDNIVNQWFMEVCRNVAMEEFDGTGDFAADSEANLDTLKRWNSETMGHGRKGYN